MFFEKKIFKEYEDSIGPEPNGYEMKFKVINLYHVIQQGKGANELDGFLYPSIRVS